MKCLCGRGEMIDGSNVCPQCAEDAIEEGRKQIARGLT